MSQPGFYQAKGSFNSTLTSSAVQRKEKFWFRLKNNAATNNKLNVNAYRKNQDANKRALTNEEIIAENKDKLMVCIDTQGYYGQQLRYCFVRREIVNSF